MCPPTRAHWRKLANTIELVLPSEATTQTANRSVQPFLHSSRQCRWACPGMTFPLIIAPSPHGSRPHLIHASLGQPESITQTASRSVQPFCTDHDRVSLNFTTTAPFPLKITPSRGISGPPSNTWFPGPTRVLNPNGISMASAVLAGLISVIDTETDRPTDKQTTLTRLITIGRIYVYT